MSAKRLNMLFLLRGLVWLVVIAGVIVVIVIGLRHLL